MHEGVGERSVARRIAFENGPFATAPRVFTGFSMIDVRNGPSLRLSSAADAVDTHGFSATVKTWNECRVWSCRVSCIAIDSALFSDQLERNAGIPPHLRGGEDEDDDGGGENAENPRLHDLLLQGGVGKASVHMAGYPLHQGEESRKLEVAQVFRPPFANTPIVATFITALTALLHERVVPEDGSDDEAEQEEGENAPPKHLLVDARLAVSDEKRSPFGFHLRFGTWKDSKIFDAEASWIAIGQRSQVHRPLMGLQQHYESLELEEYDEEEREEEEYDEEEVEDDLGPRAGPAPKRQLSIPVIIPEEASDDEEAAPPPAKKPSPYVPAQNQEEAEAKKDDAAKEKADDAAKECKVCMDAEINTVLIPCGHVALCFDCAQLILSKGTKECPICKKKVQQLVKTFRV